MTILIRNSKFPTTSTGDHLTTSMPVSCCPIRLEPLRHLKAPVIQSVGRVTPFKDETQTPFVCNLSLAEVDPVRYLPAANTKILTDFNALNTGIVLDSKIQLVRNSRSFKIKQAVRRDWLQ